MKRFRLVLRLQFISERPGEAWVSREGEGCRMQSGSVEDTAVPVFRDPPRRGRNVFSLQQGASFRVYLLVPFTRRSAPWVSSES